MGLPCVGLLVDKGNPVGEALYVSVGFRHVNDNSWGGHPMKHLTSSNSSALGRADASIALHSLVRHLVM
jgi:hypothetical protein